MSNASAPSPAAVKEPKTPEEEIGSSYRKYTWKSTLKYYADVVLAWRNHCLWVGFLVAGFHFLPRLGIFEWFHKDFHCCFQLSLSYLHSIWCCWEQYICYHCGMRLWPAWNGWWTPPQWGSAKGWKWHLGLSRARCGQRLDWLNCLRLRHCRRHLRFMTVLLLLHILDVDWFGGPHILVDITWQSENSNFTGSVFHNFHHQSLASFQKILANFSIG